MTTKPLAPRHLRVFLYALQIVCFVQALVLMAGYLRAQFGEVPLKYIELLTGPYYMALVLYGGGTIYEKRKFNVEQERKHRPLEFVVVAWFALLAIFVAVAAFDYRIVEYEVAKDMAVTAFTVGLIFGATRTGKDMSLPETWFK